MGTDCENTADGPLASAASESLSKVYGLHAPEVRQVLLGFGVSASDLDDLCQEVFLVVMGKRGALGDIARVDLWLREICRKVAAAHRRRGGRAREVSAHGLLDAVADCAPTQSTEIEQREDSRRLHRALRSLDDEARDLIAMHELGGLPLVDVATLVDRDRKTVQKRLERANRRLMHLFREHETRRVPDATAPPFPVPLAAKGERARAQASWLLAQNPDITIGLVGPVMVAVWPGPPTLEALELLDQQLRATTRSLGTGLVYLAIVESTTGTPNLAARQKITAMLKVHTEHYGVYPHVLLGGFSWIARPILAGLAQLAGIPGLPFFGSVERAIDWLVADYLHGGLVDAETLVKATHELRALAARSRA